MIFEPHAGSVAHTDGPFGVSEYEIGGDCDQRRRNRACQDEHIVVHSQAAKNVASQPAGIDGGCNGGGANTDHRCDSHAGEDHSQGKGQLDLEKQLAIGHPHAPAGLPNGRINAIDSREGVTNDRAARRARGRQSFARRYLPLFYGKR
jgi:hypothetical protein